LKARVGPIAPPGHPARGHGLKEMAGLPAFFIGLAYPASGLFISRFFNLAIAAFPALRFAIGFSVHDFKPGRAASLTRGLPCHHGPCFAPQSRKNTTPFFKPE
jgi:hypothetical protein